MMLMKAGQAKMKLMRAGKYKQYLLGMSDVNLGLLRCLILHSHRQILKKAKHIQVIDLFVFKTSS